MTDERCWHPDLLRRFEPTPYIFTESVGSNRISVASNDLDIALSLRRSDVVASQRTRSGGLLCKIIRDFTASADDVGTLIIRDGRIRVLYQGTGTILIHDHERSELLGFVARNVNLQELVSSLIPSLLNA